MLSFLQALPILNDDLYEEQLVNWTLKSSGHFYHMMTPNTRGSDPKNVTRMKYSFLSRLPDFNLRNSKEYLLKINIPLSLVLVFSSTQFQDHLLTYIFRRIN